MVRYDDICIRLMLVPTGNALCLRMTYSVKVYRYKKWKSFTVSFNVSRPSASQVSYLLACIHTSCANPDSTLQREKKVVMESMRVLFNHYHLKLPNEPLLSLIEMDR